MGNTRRRIAVLALATAGPVLSSACQEPTQITLEIDTDVGCGNVSDTSITTGRPEGVESRAPATVTRQCDPPTGRVGSLVLVPSGGDDDVVAVRVVTGVGKSAARCVEDGYRRTPAEPPDAGCIVARREVAYVPNTPLRLPIDMTRDCLDVPCDPRSTCLRGTCVSATVLCTGDSCVPEALDDGGAPDGDASFEPDVSAEASVESGVGREGGPDGDRPDADSGTDVTAPVCAPAGTRLTSLSVGGSGASPALDPCTLRYTATVERLMHEASVTLAADDPLAAIRVNGVPALAGIPSAPVVLSPGTTEIQILVTSARSESANYVLAVDHAGGVAEQEHVVPTLPLERQLGWAVAMSGDTIAFGADAIVEYDGGSSTTDAAEGGRAYVYVKSGGGWVEQANLRGENTELRDFFGTSLALEGDVLVVGAREEDGAGQGPTADPSDNGAEAAGAAYVFRRQGTTWTQEAYLKASNAADGNRFGSAVRISGGTIVIGAPAERGGGVGPGVAPGQGPIGSAPAAGAVYVFDHTSGAWRERAYLKASNPGDSDGFGASVDISGDTIVVGATGESSSARGIDGAGTDDSSHASGAAYVFVRSAGVWTQQAYVKASNTRRVPDGGGALVYPDWFGAAVAISGDIMVVSSPLESGTSLGVNGDQEARGTIPSGAAYAFFRSGGRWAQEAYLKQTTGGGFFGWSVAAAGNLVAVGAHFGLSPSGHVDFDAGTLSEPGGAAYVFARNGGSWAEHAFIKPASQVDNDAFGSALALTSGRLLVGAPGRSAIFTGFFPFSPTAGEVYVFE